MGKESHDYWQDEPEKFASAYRVSFHPGRWALHELLLKRQSVGLDFIDVQPGETVADIGCGSAELLKIAAEKAGKAYGVDYSQRMLDAARVNNPTDKVELLLSDCRPIPLASESIDKLTCLGVLEYIEDTQDFVSEIHRIMRKGGVVALAAPKRVSPFAPLRWSAKFRRQLLDVPPMRTFLYKEAVSLIERSGLKITDCRSVWATTRVFRAVKS